jgi:hypothetical protein
MALNPHHTFEELGGVKCSIIEKNASAERVNFIKRILEYNGYSVVVEKSPPPKSAVKSNEPLPEPTETFTLGVTDYTFNLTHAIFSRGLLTPENKVISISYWKQEKIIESNDAWYWKK